MQVIRYSISKVITGSFKENALICKYKLFEVRCQYANLIDFL